MHQRCNIARKQCLHHEFIALVTELGKWQIVTRYPAVSLFEFLEPVAPDEDAVQGVQKLVSGCARHRPLGGHRLLTPKNLFHHYIKTRRHRLQTLQITTRVPKTVDVIDSQTRDFAGTDELKSLGVAVFEYFGNFDAKAHQLINIEKTPVIDLFVADFPVREAI